MIRTPIGKGHDEEILWKSSFYLTFASTSRNLLQETTKSDRNE